MVGTEKQIKYAMDIINGIIEGSKKMAEAEPRMKNYADMSINTMRVLKAVEEGDLALAEKICDEHEVSGSIRYAITKKDGVTHVDAYRVIDFFRGDFHSLKDKGYI